MSPASPPRWRGARRVDLAALRRGRPPAPAPRPAHLRGPRRLRAARPPGRAGAGAGRPPPAGRGGRGGPRRAPPDLEERIELRPLEEVVDLEPVLGPELLELARFVADYYMAPLGEVFRAMLPPDLPPWGDRRVWLTDAGALAPPRSPAEAAVVEALRGGGRMSVAELQARLGLSGPRRGAGGLGGRRADRRRGAPAARRPLRHRGRAAAPATARRSSRPAGRSPPGRAAVEYLARDRPAGDDRRGRAPPSAAPRPSSGGWSTCGVLRQFTQVERLSLDRHMLGRGRRAEPSDRAPPRPGGGAGAASRARSQTRQLRAVPAPGHDRLRQDRGLPAGGRGGARQRAGPPSCWCRRSPWCRRWRGRSSSASASSWRSCTRAWARASATRSGSGCAAARRGWSSGRARPSSRRSPTSA